MYGAAERVDNCVQQLEFFTKAMLIGEAVMSAPPEAAMSAPPFFHSVGRGDLKF